MAARRGVAVPPASHGLSFTAECGCFQGPTYEWLGSGLGFLLDGTSLLASWSLKKEYAFQFA